MTSSAVTRGGPANSIRVPLATYRLQMNASFRFPDARNLIPYLHDLGISDVYLSPIFAARAGSSHGYDVIDPTRLNPELGTEAEFLDLSHEIKRHEMGLLLDIVPNHMAASGENRWWVDVLEHGRRSPYADFFDIDWSGGADARLRDKVLLPILGKPLDAAIGDREIEVRLDEDGFCLRYHEWRLPIAPRRYEVLLGEHAARFPALRGAAQGPEGLATLKREIWTAYGGDTTFRRQLDQGLRRFGGDALAEVIADQNYEPAFWREASSRINYRRFFDINGLVAMKVEDPTVFDATHSLIVHLVRSGLVTGLRIDHVDGLWQPEQYLSRLQAAVGNIYVAVEKILLGNESLRRTWDVSGTTGYDYLGVVTGLFADADGLKALDRSYSSLTRPQTIQETVLGLKRAGLGARFGGEVLALARQLNAAARQPEAALVAALEAVTTALPVYRTYLSEAPASREDRRRIREAMADARNRGAAPKVVSALGRALLDDSDAAGARDSRQAAMRWQQLSGAAMAKGLEDSALYVYNRLVSLNDVGSSPASIETPPDIEAFHTWNRERLADWPYAMNATSTHDTKRSEDVRARINVLSEMPDAWRVRAERWRKLNQRHKTRAGRALAPSRNEEHLLYQVMLGAWPLSASEEPGFVSRLKEYMIKATREAGVNSDWTAINEAYEAALTSFIERCCSESSSPDFLADFHEFQAITARFGVFNSLAQTLLKITSPGLPDFYQGSELWDFSLVDPDNRRPVDFARRRRYLGDITTQLPADLMEDWPDGRVKLFLTAKAMAFRQQQRRVFERGRYTGLEATHGARDHVVAFARRYRKDWAVVAVPRLVARMTGGVLPGRAAWGDEMLILPGNAPAAWRDCFTGEERPVSRLGEASGIRLGLLFGDFPAALLSPEARA